MSYHIQLNNNPTFVAIQSLLSGTHPTFNDNIYITDQHQTEFDYFFLISMAFTASKRATPISNTEDKA